MKLVKILSALAVFAAAGMMAAGCDSPAGSGAGDEAVSAGITAPMPDGAVGVADSDTAAVKTIKVKFEVLNGGIGLLHTYGIISTQDGSYLVYYRD